MEPICSIWVTGAGGLIGSHILDAPSAFASEWDVIGLTRDIVDLTDTASVKSLFVDQSPSAIIHCAAMSRSPDCQKDPAEARRQNVDVTRTLADLAADIPLVLLSTDLVFDGQKGDYVETDSVNPMSVYAESKLAAEAVVLANPKHLVVRTSLNAGESPTGDRGMDEQLMHAWCTGKTMSLFTDEFRCPIPASATARAIWDLINANASGLFHIAGAEKLSRWQIGELLAMRHPKFKEQISPGSLKNYSGAPRSPDTSLDCSKAQTMLSFDLPKFSEWLANE
jgi:dTDP-4-dehydrorhamnose reductase